MELEAGNDRHGRPLLARLISDYGLTAPLPIAGIVAWTAPMPWPTVASWLAIWWAASILLFLAGVRRGLSFRAADGPRRSEWATIIWLFLLGAGALVAPTQLFSLTLLTIGYASVAVLDPAAARSAAAPAHFARVRPPQMAVGLLGLIALVAWRMAVVMPV